MPDKRQPVGGQRPRWTDADPDHNDQGKNAMMPWIISQDLMRANEQETIRATRYAHHRAQTYRRPGPFLASLIQAWMSKVPLPWRVNTALVDLTPVARDTLRLTVSDLGRIDASRALDGAGSPSRIGKSDRSTPRAAHRFPLISRRSGATENTT